MISLSCVHTAGCPRYVPGRISITSPSRACLAASLRELIFSPGPTIIVAGASARAVAAAATVSGQRLQTAIRRPADFTEIIRRGRQLVADLGRKKRRHAEAGDHQELAPGLGKEGMHRRLLSWISALRSACHKTAPARVCQRAAAWHYSLPVTRKMPMTRPTLPRRLITLLFPLLAGFAVRAAWPTR